MRFPICIGYKNFMLIIRCLQRQDCPVPQIGNGPFRRTERAAGYQIFISTAFQLVKKGCVP